MAKPNKVDPFARDHGDSFNDPAKEAFCREWASSGSNAKACAAAGVQNKTGLIWRQNAAIAARITQLKLHADTFVGMSPAAIVRMLRENAEAAAADGKWKDSTDALMHIYKIVTTNKEVMETPRPSAEPADMTDEQLAEYREKMFPSPKLPADTRQMVPDDEGTYVEEVPAETEDDSSWLSVSVQEHQ